VVVDYETTSYSIMRILFSEVGEKRKPGLVVDAKHDFTMPDQLATERVPLNRPVAETNNAEIFMDADLRNANGGWGMDLRERCTCDRPLPSIDKANDATSKVR